MATGEKDRKPEAKQQWERDLEQVKMLLILLVNKMDVDKKDIAKTMGISKGRLSQVLNPKKYKSK